MALLGFVQALAVNMLNSGVADGVDAVAHFYFEKWPTVTRDR
jgi:hypothetical protein